MSDILWLDDNISRYRPFFNAFRSEPNVNVEGAADIGECISKLRNNSYSVILLDIVLGAKKIFSYLSEIVDIAGSAKIYLTSAYLFRHDVSVTYANCDQSILGRVGNLDKDELPDLKSKDSVKKFLENLESDQFFETRVNEVPVHSEIKHPLLRWDKFVTASSDQKQEIELLVAEKVQAIKERYFDEGYVMLAFMGDFEEPLFKTTDRSEFDRMEQFEKIATSYNQTVFIFTDSGSIDDLSGGNQCSKSMRTDKYPIVGFKVGDTKYWAHFDTGNPESVFDHNVFENSGLYKVSNLFVRDKRGDIDFVGYRIKPSTAVFFDANEAEVVGTIRGFSATNFSTKRISLKCPKDCSSNSENDGKFKVVCKFRNALLGRNLPEDIGYNFLMDRRSNKVFFVGDE